MPQKEADFLLIDISNSFTKVAFSTGRRIGRVARIATRLLTARALAKVIGGRPFGSAVLSSVVPEGEGIVLRHLGKRPVLRVGPDLNLGVGIDYPHPRSIGPDRLANAASAMAICGAPVIVVDFGTAVTFDIISRGGRYVGGVIAPGLEVMTDYLYQRTALLPKIGLLEPRRAIGKSTRGAMLAGAVYGYRGLVKEILLEIKKEMGPPPARVIATGGYAKLIAAKLPEIEEVHPRLTLEGLRIIGMLNTGRPPAPVR